MKISGTEDGAEVPHLIFNIAQLRYRFGEHRASVSAVAPTGEKLSVVALAQHNSDREAAFLASDAALRSGWIQRDGIRHRVGLYVPYSCEVCIGGVPETAVYSDRVPLAVVPEGVVASLVQNGMRVGERTLSLVTASLATSSRRILALQESESPPRSQRIQPTLDKRRARAQANHLSGAIADRKSQVGVEGVTDRVSSSQIENEFERVAVVPSGVIVLEWGEYL